MLKYDNDHVILHVISLHLVAIDCNEWGGLRFEYARNKTNK